MTQPVENSNVTYNAPDGQMFGRLSTKKISVYGTTPAIRWASTSTSDVSTTTTTSLSTNGVGVESWGFMSQAEINNAVTAVSTMHIALKNLGLIA